VREGGGRGAWQGEHTVAAAREALPVEVHHTHLASLNFSKKFLGVRDLPANSKASGRSSTATHTRETCIVHAPVP
jgi:hypothetical protein